MSSRASLLILSLMAGAVAASPTLAADTIGSTIGVAHVVTAQLAEDTRTLTLGDNVRQNELIEVSRDGSGEFRLLDDTKLALGPGAQIVLDAFVYDPAKADNAIAMRFAKGAFRFITGLAEKPAYRIDVPTASITVRGTIFDVFVEQGGTSWLLLHEGAVTICSTSGVCRDHDEIGKLVRIGDDGALSHPTRWTSLPRAERISFDDAFPFVARPPSFKSEPTLTREALLQPTSDTVTEPPPRKPNAKAAPKPASKAAVRKKAAAGSDQAQTPMPVLKRKPKQAKAPATARTKAAVAKTPRKTDPPPKRDRATTERERALDVAAQYAPKAIERLRRNRTIERAETSRKGEGSGWRRYVDTYAKGR